MALRRPADATANAPPVSVDAAGADGSGQLNGKPGNKVCVDDDAWAMTEAHLLALAKSQGDSPSTTLHEGPPTCLIG